jgi:NADH:ubiquinone oxidoreductase subunit 6 (subunit J)
MTTSQTLIAQLVLLVVVGVAAFNVYQAWPIVGIVLVAVYAVQIMMLMRSAKAVWRYLGKN